MSEKVFKALIHLDFPGGMQDDEQSPPPADRPAISFSELDQIIRDGCGEDFTYVRYDCSGALRNVSDTVYIIKEV